MITKEQWFVVLLAAVSGGGSSALSSAIKSDDYVTRQEMEKIQEKMESGKDQRRRDLDIKLDALLLQTHQMRVDTEVMKAQVLDMRDYLQQRFGWSARK